jgi:putative ABC transport system permease protein
MPFLSQVRSFLRRFRHGRLAETELDAEMRSCVDLLADEKRAQGMDRRSAERAARIELGGVEQLKEQVREARSGAWLEAFWLDLRYGARMLSHAPGFAAVAILTLALGIGANTAIFSVIDAVLLTPLPYQNPQRLVTFKANQSLPDLTDVTEQCHAFSAGGGVNVEPMDYTGGAEPQRVRAGYVNAGLFEVLGVSPLLGRVISSSDDRLNGPRNVVLSYHFWRDSLAGNPSVLGRTIPLSGNRYTVIGVMPSDFALPESDVALYVSLRVAYPEAATHRGVHFMRTYWRLKPSVSQAQAQAAMAPIDERLARLYPDEERGRHTQLVPLREWLTGDVRPALLILFGAVGLVLLIACANFASLLLARAVARHRELVVRASLGAGPGRLIRQSLTESVLLSLVGGGFGLLLAVWGTQLLLDLKPEELARLNAIRADERVLFFVLAISIFTGIVFGLAPAWTAARANVAEALKDAGRSPAAAHSGGRLRKLLVVWEIALALVLLVGAGLLLRGFSLLRSVDPGFDPHNVLTMQIQLPASRYAAIPKQTAFRRAVLARLNSLPGVNAAMVSDLPLGGNWLTHNFVIDGRPPVPVGDEPEVEAECVMGDYFRVMHIPILDGRALGPEDREGKPLVAVVNQTFVRVYFPHQSPIGARIRWARDPGPPKWMTIVGVAGDVKQLSLNRPAVPAVFTPFAQSDETWRRWMGLVLRVPSATAVLVQSVKQAVWSQDSQIPVNEIQTMDQLLSVSLAEQRFNLFLLSIFAALALALTAVGIYGVIAYTVRQRRQEIGIRMALGAGRREVVRMVLGQGARLAFAGAALGLAGALGLTRLMASLLYGVKPTDVATFAAATAVLIGVALAACYVPARRATRVDPMIALRYE